MKGGTTTGGGGKEVVEKVKNTNEPKFEQAGVEISKNKAKNEPKLRPQLPGGVGGSGGALGRDGTHDRDDRKQGRLRHHSDGRTALIARGYSGMGRRLVGQSW